MRRVVPSAATRVLCFVCVLASVSCLDSPDLYLLDDPSGPSDWSDLRRRMNVIVNSQGFAREVEPDVFTGSLQADCALILTSLPQDGSDVVPLFECSSLNTNSVLDTTLPGGTCHEVACQVQEGLCVAHRLMEIAATPRSTTVAFTDQVAPQSQATRAALYEQAIRVSRETVLRATDALRAAVGDPATSTCAPGIVAEELEGALYTTQPGNPPAPTNGEALAAGLVEAYHLMREAGEGALTKNVALADAAYADQPSQTRAYRQAFFAPVLSRGHAANLLAGPFPEADDQQQALESFGSDPPASAPRPTREVEVALSAIREAAPPGERVLDTSSVPLDDLIFGDTSGLPADVRGSVRERLEELYDRDDFPDDDSFYEYLGSSRAGFEGARERLIDEHLAFARDSSMRLAPRVLVTDGGVRTTSFVRYASTVTPPTPLPAAHWSAISRDTMADIDDVNSITLAGNVPDFEYARRGIAQTADFAISNTTFLLQQALPSTVAQALSTLAVHGERERTARIEVSVDFPNQLGVLRVLGVPAADLQVVEGPAGLSCAVLGVVEGQPCNLDDYLIGVTMGSGTPDARSGFDTYTDLDISGYLPTSGDSTTVYAVRRRDGGTTGVAGQHAALGGAVIHELDGGSGVFRRAIPVDELVEESIRDTVMADPAFPAEPAIDCASLTFTDQIPLENELSDDRDAFESSWRTYLQLARQAATEADALGTELLDATLQMDVRAEAAMDELERVCGASIDIDFLDDERPVYGGSCAGGAPCPADYDCRQNACLLDTLGRVLDGTTAGPDALRLQRCLAPDAIVDGLVSLGSRTLCVWRKDHNNICGGESAHPCPYFADEYEDGCSGIDSLQVPDGFAIEEVATNLGLFDSTTAAAIGGATTDHRARETMCRAIRVLRRPDRTDTRRDLAWRLLTVRHEFNVEAMRATAQNLRWEAEPEDYSTIFRNGEPWLTTGTFRSGPATTWPCAGTTPVDCSLGEVGLFCFDDVAPCADQTTRAALNDRLGRAVLAARVLTTAGVDGFRFPVYTESDDEFVVPFGPSHAVSSFSDETWLEYEDVLFAELLFAGFVGDGVSARVVQPPGSSPTTWTITRALGEASDARTATFVSVDLRNTLNPARFAGLNRIGRFWAPLRSEHYSAATPLVEPDEQPDIGRLLQFPHADEGRLVWSQEDLAEDVSRYWLVPSSARPERLRANQALIAPDGLRARDILDGFEVICEAELERTGPSTTPRCSLDAPPRVRTVADLPLFREFMSCAASRLEESGERTVLYDVPEVVVDAVATDDGVGVFPGAGGEFAIAAVQVREGLIELQGLRPTLATELRQFTEDMRQLEIFVQSSDIRDELAALRFRSTVSSQMTACLTAVSTAQGSQPLTAIGAAAAAAATCMNSAVQIGIALRTRSLESELIDGETETAFSRFMQSFNSRVANLQAVGEAISRARERMDAGLARLESLRRDASRAVARATFADSDAAGRMYPVNTLMRRRQNTLALRYARARTFALKMAQLARVALEQRLGVELVNLERDLSLVEPPRLWADQICEMSGMDYQGIRDARDPEFESYEDEYIGDYVRRLEAVVESYRLDYPFSDGSDTSVISLRDELHNVRAECSLSGPNRLYESGSLHVRADPTFAEIAAGSESADGVLGWEVEGCEPIDDPDDPGTLIVRNCVSAIALDDPTVDASLPVELGRPRAYEVVFGDSTDLGSDVLPTQSSFRFAAPYFSRLVQHVALEPGHRYRLSWYGHSGGVPGPMPEVALTILDAGDAEVPGGAVAMEAASMGWFRHWRFFDVPASAGADHRVAIEPMPAMPPAMLQNQSVRLAGVMLEDVTGRVVGEEGLDTPATRPPALYHDTGQNLTRPRLACEDTDGDRFRTSGIWRRRCEIQCPVGVATCDEETSTSACYWETSFGVSLPAIEQGEIVHSGGFARGNYNYRIDRIGLNLVGAGLRDCSDLELASTCYGSGSIPFSLDHLGPYPVRDHLGNDQYEAPLFTGRIQHGRGLAAERYITNPLSSGDRGLVEPYMHAELRGRPLSGTFRLRIFEEPGVRFDRLEDVQIVLDYRYWTRLD